MRGKCFRIKTPTVAIERRDDETRLLQVPSNAAVTVIGGLADSNRLVDVEWDGRTVMMFTRDLLERCEPIPE